MTLDPDVERLLRQAMEQTQESFKAILNQAIRRGLASLEGEPDEEPFVVVPKDLGLRPGIDATKMQEVSDEMEIDAYLELTRQLEARQPEPGS